MCDRTYKIVIKGLVQGIGYRPFVAELAESCDVCGWVRNTAGIVTVLVSGEAANVGRFLQKLKTGSPDGARVEEINCEEISYQDFKQFSIIESEAGTGLDNIPVIPADLPTCEGCLRELHDAQNRRYHHPFISCTSCGPRYSIMESLPYDRETISMKKFAMCQKCSTEYAEPGNIRRHAQTIACPDCGPKLMYHRIFPAEKIQRGVAGNDSALREAAVCLKNGGIVAIKDIGGYHLACTPFSEDTLRYLRVLKMRERKPFAVMFANPAMVKDYCFVNKREEELLLSAPRPIVLLKRKANDRPLAANVCGSSPDVGAMLACNPLQTLLIEECGPLVMTSANASGELLILENEAMICWMKQRAEEIAKQGQIEQKTLAVLSHDRPIVTSLDDSIVRVVCGRMQILRRARGYVPQPVQIHTNRKIFAAGGDLKACFCYTGEGRAYLSQYLGDLQEEGCYRAYQKEIGRMKALFGFAPEYAACDMHPGYLSAVIPDEMKTAELCRIQHHEAHVASVIAEHGLQGKVLGFAFDGTGFGRDRTVWGSEAFVWDGNTMRRLAHLKPVRLIGGDEGAKNADVILYGYLASFDEKIQQHIAEERAQFPWFDAARSQLVAKAVKSGVNAVHSSSMGRLFDAVSAFLDICHYNSYEGEAAIELENLARTADCGCELRIELVYSAADEEYLGDTEPLFSEMLKAMGNGVSRAEIARGFIDAVSDFVCDVCCCAAENVSDAVSKRSRQIALSGGTFQNRILLERTITRLEESGYSVYINEQVPPGDGGICLGQAYLCAGME